MVKPTYIYRAILDRVIDGDTLLVYIDHGFDVHIRVRLRLLGVNAPEVFTPSGVAAKTRLTNLLSIGEETIVDIAKRDRYGRWLGEVWLMRSGRQISLNKLLIEGVVK